MLLNKRSEGNETGRCGLFAENANISLLPSNVSILGNIFRPRKLREQILQLITWAEICFSCGHLQSNQVKRTPRDYCNELIIWILNPLVVPIIRLLGLIPKNFNLILIFEMTGQFNIYKKWFINAIVRGTVQLVLEMY